MISHRFVITLAAGLAVFANPIHAQVQTDLVSQRPAVLTALHAAEQGQLTPQDVGRLAEHPLRPWLEVINLDHGLSRANVKSVREVLARSGAQPANDWLRERWLAELVRRQDWPTFRQFYQGGGSLDLRCADLTARATASTIDASWISDAKSVWLTGHSLPTLCDAPLNTLAAHGAIDDTLRWQRIDMAAAEGQTALMRFLAGRLPADQATRARDYADFIDSPDARAASWPKDARSQAMAIEGLRRLAKRSPDDAEALLAKTAAPLALDDTQRGRVLYEIALWTVASYLPGSAARLAAVPASAYDPRLHEWRVREAMSRNDDRSALLAIEAMPQNQRNDPRWQYFEARLRERLGQLDAARPLYAAAATTATFHGFLAADRINQPYALCPAEPDGDPDLRARVAALPGLQRAIEWFVLDRPGLANREWTAVLAGLDDTQRYVAIDVAQQAHWYDRAVFSLGSRPEDLRQYRLRFPLHHARTLRREAAKHGLDPAWVAAQTRAESAFMPMARSGANARGLMQLIPSTAARTAQRLGIPWTGEASLYRPTTNLILGTATLRHELDQHGGLPYLAIAAYNAGPTPVARWQQARGNFDSDFWIETVSYKETRDYIARVLAFSVIYDWRLYGKAVPLSARLRGATVADSERRSFRCPQPPLASTP